MALPRDTPAPILAPEIWDTTNRKEAAVTKVEFTNIPEMSLLFCMCLNQMWAVCQSWLSLESIGNPPSLIKKMKQIRLNEALLCSVFVILAEIKHFFLLNPIDFISRASQTLHDFILFIALPRTI